MKKAKELTIVRSSTHFLSRVQMHWICPLYKLSTFWAQQVERIRAPCWEVLSGVESCWGKFETGQTFRSTRLNISFVSQPSMRGSTKSSAFAQQRSTCWAHARPVPSVSKNSQPWFSMSLCEIIGLLNMLSNCWGHLNTALSNTSANTQHVESLYSGQIQCICTQPYAQLQNRSLHVVDD